MTFFEDHRGQPAHATSPDQVAYLRTILDAHANQPPNGRCRVCDLPGCPDLRYTYDHLAAAEQLMAEPERWLPAERREYPR
jgi:hypothetical protein